MPSAFPNGCWPSRGRTPLVLSQQFAINSFFTKEEEQSALFTVNGPPGTGKTTLLRDVIAHLVVERAKKLADFDTPAHALTPIDTTEGEETFLLHSSLLGFEMVVASSNNGAIENITLEVPGLAAVDPSIVQEVNYFTDWAKILLKEESWGLIAARLGNKANRDRFIRDFWLNLPFDPDTYTGLFKALRDSHLYNGFEKYLGNLSAEPADWEKAKANFEEALAVEQKIRDERQSSFNKIEAAFLTSKSEGITALKSLLQANDMPLEHVPTFFWCDQIALQSPPSNLSVIKDQDYELTSPWMDEKWQQARVHVFLAALTLQKTFIASNAKALTANLKRLMQFFAGDASAPGVEMQHLWATFFLLIPAVSTTFASFPKLFGMLHKESLGYLLVDEAGQTQPQAVVGALWCSKRALFVGDPLQLEPIHAVHEGLQQQLAIYGKVSSHWMPYLQSAMTVADRVSTLGTVINNKWIGVPLRVHRRCDHSIFKISNQMAYDNLMVYGTPTRDELALPETQWFHVESTFSESNWVKEEGDVLESLLAQLMASKIDMNRVYVITPFRDVVYHTRILRKKYGVRAETIHSVQGKENDIVILILGGKPQMQGTRWWATRKPNLLNVAVSRAKRRLYVIGNKTLWAKHPYACILARALS